MSETTEHQPQNFEQEETPAWLKHLQNNSWEPEIFISGIMLAFIFAFPSKIFDFSVRLIQENGVEYLGAFLILIYVSMVLGIFKIFFIIHLLLRFTWAGILGMSYAFPKGVMRERLFKNAQHFNYPTPLKLVVKLERICSMTFAFPTMLVLMMFLFATYFGGLLLIYHFFNVPFLYIYIFFLLTVMAFSILMMSSKKMKFKDWYGTSFLSTVSAVYQSNLGKWSMTSYLLFIFVLAAPSIINDISGFGEYHNITNVSDEQQEWPNAAKLFEDAQLTPKRFARAFMPSETVEGDFARLSLAYYEQDQQMPLKLNKLFKTTLDTLQWGEVKVPTDLYKIYINDSLAKNMDWSNIRVASTGQRAYQTLLNVATLRDGIHKIRVEKLVVNEGLLALEPEVRYRKNWGNFTFVKLSNR